MLKSCLHLWTSIEDLTVRTSLKFGYATIQPNMGMVIFGRGCLYHATSDQACLDYTGTNGNNFTNWGSPTWFS